MRRNVAGVFLAIVVGVAAGFWMAHFKVLTFGFLSAAQFTPWQCALVGGAAAIVVLLVVWAVRARRADWMMASALVGIGVGLWTAALTYLPYCAPFGRCPAYLGQLPPTFAQWQCGLFGAAAAIVVLLVGGALNRRRRITPKTERAQPAT